jgi:hypothetical protein
LTAHPAWWDSSLEPDLLTKVLEDPDKPHIDDLTFADDGYTCFLKLDGRGEWSIKHSEDFPLNLEEARAEVPDLDERLRTVLFGQGGTHIYVLEGGFHAELIGKANHDEHPLKKV